MSSTPVNWDGIILALGSVLGLVIALWIWRAKDEGHGT